MSSHFETLITKSTDHPCGPCCDPSYPLTIYELRSNGSLW
uniref:Uncharacterized protein n=1 Tax=Rhizophora mucronata TaxID=61149 RepID=A0A2P2Q0D4_RHIMU